MEPSDRFCISCGKRLKESVSKNASTHPGICRDENTQSLLKKHNLQVKIDKIHSVLEFLEECFSLGIDIELLTNILSHINMYHTTTEDFVMTAYYLMSSEVKNGITIRDITEAAYTWDERNDKKRSDSSKQRIIDQIKLLDKYIDVTQIQIAIALPTWRDDIQKVVSRTKIDIQKVWKQPSSMTKERIQYVNKVLTKIRFIINQKFGYNRNAYKMLKKHIDVVIRDASDQIPSAITAITNKLLIDQRYVTEMIDTYESSKRLLIGRDATVIVGGIIYYISLKYKLGLSQEVIASVTRTSAPSIRKIYNILHSIGDNSHDTTEREIS